MKKQLFERELSKASALYTYGKDDEKEFWRGYQRGVRRRYHGSNFETEAAHTQWLNLIFDDYHREAGRGYRSGFYGPVKLSVGDGQSSHGDPVFWDTDGSVLDFEVGFCALREWWGLNELATIAGVSVRTAEGWCAGRKPSADSLLKLMAVFK